MTKDLHWILTAPSLMNTSTALAGTAWIRQFQAPIAADSTSIALQSPSYKLGLYYEDLVEFFFKSSSKLIVYKRNIQVKDNKRTVGEFDFVGRLGSPDLAIDFHLECAVKFYLRVGPGDRLADYIGPAKHDRLDLKWQKISRQQIRLSETNAGLATCQALGLIPTEKLILIQGYLFHPFQEGLPAQLHPEINPDHLRGWWLRHKEMALLDQQSSYVVMKKPYWLSLRSTKLMSYNALCEVVAEQNKPLLICRVNPINGTEIDRGFIVPDSW